MFSRGSGSGSGVYRLCLVAVVVVVVFANKSYKWHSKWQRRELSTNDISWRKAEAADKRDHKKWRYFSISLRWQVQNLWSNAASSSTPTSQ